ncbi:MAG: hypothetical protein NUV77_01775, partial [Thermoguttaceae bacterium]|nr:hypothetical protein [Thermoguttaceae bacterium]
MRSTFLWLAIVAGFCMMVRAAEPVGKRPYEMDWANRTEDDHPALIDFENLDGWTVECRDAEARFTRTREEQLWGKHVGTLVYRGSGPQPVVTLRPPKPMAAPAFDCVNFWVYGNNWAWVPDRTTPPVDIAVLFEAKGKETVRVPMGRVHWREWWVMHRRLTPEQQTLVKDGAALVAIEIAGGRNAQDRKLHFDNLSVYRESLPPLTFEPRPLRNLTLPPGQTTGTNTGPGKLPFPTREETILPDNLTTEFKVSLEASDGAYAFHYRGKDGHLVYRYKPATGTLGDVTAQWEPPSPQAPLPQAGEGRIRFQPMVEGGVTFARDDKAGHAPPPQAGEGPAKPSSPLPRAGEGPGVRVPRLVS